MYDIVFCKDDLCPMKSKCHRYKPKKDSDYILYFDESPRDERTDECDFYIDNES